MYALAAEHGLQVAYDSCRLLKSDAKKTMGNNRMTADQICVHCQAVPATTKDHTPPENIYTKPLPPERPWVPSCDRCNKSFSKDDEYFRLKVGLNDKARGHPDVKGIIPVIFKSLNRIQAARFGMAFLRDLQYGPEFTQSGLYAGNRLAFDVDLSRIFRVVERTARGLYFVEKSELLPVNCRFWTISDDTLHQNGADAAEEIRSNIIAPLLAQPEHVVGRNAFSYRYEINGEVSAWLMTFYGAIPFVTVILPPEKMTPQGP
ncbi:MAG: hypothetical protein JSS49_22555 [Planctomycetes bacterium]|nr:hypothetical protein [Planctomycetota bacterium]